MFSFHVVKLLGKARLTQLATPHGILEGPFFQFVATNAAIRGMVGSEDLAAMGVQIVLANTYHLFTRQGDEVVGHVGGLHEFMQWNRPITTDSGGYQVFSLHTFVKLDSEGVTFRSPRDGTTYHVTPESVVHLQGRLGADFIMPLDVCTPFHADRDEVQTAVLKTTEWAKRSQETFERTRSSRPSQELYGIVQGGVFPDLREQAAAQLAGLDVFGYGIGGELREGRSKMLSSIVSHVAECLPRNKPRYLMGYGLPEDIVEAVRVGVDQFDCVLPVRNGRHGQVFYDLNVVELKASLSDPARPIDPHRLYSRISMRRAQYRMDTSLFSINHPVLRKYYTKAYVHHLMKSEELSGSRMIVLHNIFFYENLMREIRRIIDTYGEKQR